MSSRKTPIPTPTSQANQTDTPATTDASHTHRKYAIVFLALSICMVLLIGVLVIRMVNGLHPKTKAVQKDDASPAREIIDDPIHIDPLEQPFELSPTVPDWNGSVALNVRQTRAMIDITREKTYENILHNLSVLAEVSPKAQRLLDEQAAHHEVYLFFAAKNEALDFIYAEYYEIPENSPLRSGNPEDTSEPGSSDMQGRILADVNADATGDAHGVRLTLPYYCQWDKRWGHKPYSGDIMGTSGCGVTAFASVASGLLQDEHIVPDAFARLSEEYGTNHGGTSPEFFSRAGQTYEIVTKSCNLDLETLKTELNAGHPLIYEVGPGDFTSLAHYIIIVGYTADNNFVVYDPVSPRNTSKIWTFETLAKQPFMGLWSFAKV